MERIVSAAAVEQKFVRVFCVPTEITANHAPSTLRAHAQRAAAATRTPLELHSDSHGARGLPAAAPTLPTKSNQMEAGGGRLWARRMHRVCGCAAEPDYGGLEDLSPALWVL